MRDASTGQDVAVRTGVSRKRKRIGNGLTTDSVVPGMVGRLPATSEGASRTPWEVILTSVACGKVVLGIASLAIASIVGDPPSPQQLLLLAHVASFAIAGAILLFGGRRDPRARLLAITFLVTASVFADSLVWTRHDIVND